MKLLKIFQGNIFFVKLLIFLTVLCTVGAIFVTDGYSADIQGMNMVSGKLGIGTDTPVTELHLNAAAIGATFRVSANSKPYLQWHNKTTGNGFAMGIENSTSLHLNYDSPIGTFNTNILRLTSTGNVGIGTSSDPTSAKLEVNGQIKMTDGNQGDGKVLSSDANGLGSWTTLSLGSLSGVTTSSTADEDILIYNSSSGDWEDDNLHTSVAEHLEDGYIPYRNTTTDKLDDTGIYYNSSTKRVGIGYTSPDTKLHVYDSDPNDTLLRTLTLERENTATSSGGDINLGTGIDFNLENGTDGVLETAGAIDVVWEDVTSTDEESSLRFSTMEAGLLVEQMRIDDSGNVGIGTNEPNVNLEVFDSLNPQINLNRDGITRLQIYANTNATYFRDDTGSAPKPIIFYNNDATHHEVLKINANGNVSFIEDKVTITQTGNVGIGTTDPKEKLDINGLMRLAKQSSAPTCNSTNDGAIALTSTYKLCVCKGSSSAWYKVSDGTTACGTW